MILTMCIINGLKYGAAHDINKYSSTKEIIEYTNGNKQNVYLYTAPALQLRYLAYPVYTMPPKGAFSNLRAIGGWDIYTQNYYDFKERNNLDGNLLDLLKDNVYLIDGRVNWGGMIYDNFRNLIIIAMKEHYGLDVKCEKIEQFDDLKIYKLSM